MERDPELPNGFQDADFEQAELEEAGRTETRIRKAGKCSHGWRQGHRGRPGIPEDGDMATCLYCGKTATEGEFDDDARELRAEY